MGGHRRADDGDPLPEIVLPECHGAVEGRVQIRLLVVGFVQMREVLEALDDSGDPATRHDGIVRGVVHQLNSTLVLYVFLDLVARLALDDNLGHSFDAPLQRYRPHC